MNAPDKGSGKPAQEPRQQSRQRSRGPRRSRVVSLSKLIPNMITVMALCAGLTGVRFALQERWEFAIGALAIAAVLDTLDGHMARLLKGQSKFGAELDSLSDIICFGVAPALIMFTWASEEARGFGWMSALFFATCMALRLARFNTAQDDPAPFASRFFSGVPAPAAAGIVCLPLIISFEIGEEIVSQPHFVASWMILVGLLVVSTIPTWSFKTVKLPHRLALPILLAAGLMVAGLPGAPWITLSLVILGYILTIPFSMRSHRRLMAIHRKSPETPPPATDEQAP